ncbi:MAG: DUF2461 domain-containing protein [Candidatus Hodarchaeales archaeon]|jgi:uncharacterized protein (TIGR02453 family)
MAMTIEFSGFPEETFSFLSNLKLNNNREWFNNHKQEYQEFLIEPTKQFVTILGRQLQKNVSSGLNYDLRLNGSGSIMRIYRDIRFKKDKTPYNTRLRTIFWEGTGKKMEEPGFFIGLDASGGKIYGGLHRFSKITLDQYRQAVIATDIGEQIEGISKDLKDSNFTVGGEHYKRFPRGYDNSHPYANYLKYSGLYAISPFIEPSVLTTPELIDVCVAHCVKMSPLHRLLVQIKNETTYTN